MSKLFKYEIRTSESNTVDVIVTSQRINNDINGNPYYSVQVWVDRGDNGNLWTPKVKGYKTTKHDSYRISSHNIEYSIQCFMNEFENAVFQV